MTTYSLLSVLIPVVAKDIGLNLDSQSILSLRRTSKSHKTIAERILERNWKMISSLFPKEVAAINGNDYLSRFKNLTIEVVEIYGLKRPAFLPVTFAQFSQIFEEAKKAEDTALLTLAAVPIHKISHRYKNAQEVRSALNDPKSLFRNTRYKTTARVYNISMVPHEIDKFLCIQKLDFSGPIVRIPLELFRLTRLKKLELANTRITSLPKDICLLSNLESLWIVNYDFVNKNLTSLPEEIGKLIKLKSLHVTKAAIRTLPKQIKELKELNYLDVSENKLITLPNGLSNLTKLNHIQFEKNPILFLEKEFCEIFEKKFELDSLKVNLPILNNLRNQSIYEATSPLAKLYQAILQRKTDQELDTLFAALSPEDKALILEVGKKTEKALLVGDDFYRAVHEAIQTKYNRLSEQEKNGLKSNLEFYASRSKTYIPASIDNLSLLADAIDLEKMDEEAFLQTLESDLSLSSARSLLLPADLSLLIPSTPSIARDFWITVPPPPPLLDSLPPLKRQKTEEQISP